VSREPSSNSYLILLVFGVYQGSEEALNHAFF
jgi:hypothetical protein